MRVLDGRNLSCDEAIVTGESLPVSKSAAAVAQGAGVGDLTSCLLMGTVVQSGDATAVVVATGSRTVFGQIAGALGTQAPQTEFQRGLARFSLLLLARSEEHTSELQSLMRISYDVCCLT